MKNIAVVFGGFSSEYEVSVKSGKFIYENLKDNQVLMYIKYVFRKSQIMLYMIITSMI